MYCFVPFMNDMSLSSGWKHSFADTTLHPLNRWSAGKSYRRANRFLERGGGVGMPRQKKTATTRVAVLIMKAAATGTCCALDPVDSGFPVTGGLTDRSSWSTARSRGRYFRGTC